MHFFLLLLVFAISQAPTPVPSEVSKPEQQSTGSQHAPVPDQRGTDQSPLVVRTLPAPKTQEESTREAKDRDEKTANDRHVVELTGLLVLIGFLQFLVYAYQAKKLRETVKSAGEQSAAMERHIREAARSATAMENVAATMQLNAAKQLRAYLTVIIGTAIYQDREDGKVFEGKVLLVNNGFTPARNIRHWSKAGILPFPLPDDFTLPRQRKYSKVRG